MKTSKKTYVAVAALSLSLACSTSGDSLLGEDGGEIEESFDSDTSGETGDSGSDETGAGTTSDEPATSSGDDSDDDGSTGTGDEPDPGPSADFPPCPEPLPDGWVFCEDFETIEDPATVFFDYQDDDGAFVIDDRQGASGQKSMRASYRAGMEGAGWLRVSFGENPVAEGATRPQYDQAEAFEEVYWRLRIRMQPGWPDAGPDRLARLTAFADSDWGEAIVAQLWSNGDDVTLAGDASTCVYVNEVPCQGSGDTSGLASLGQLVGDTALFSDDLAGQWHCVEAHVKLNTPGLSDGVFAFSINGNPEAGRNDLDWRGTWTDYGLNLLTIENFWAGGAPEDLDRWVDDLVISTEPIGCE